MAVIGAAAAGVVVAGTWLRFAVQPVVLAFEIGRWMGRWEERRVHRRHVTSSKS